MKADDFRSKRCELVFYDLYITFSTLFSVKHSYDFVMSILDCNFRIFHQYTDRAFTDLFVIQYFQVFFCHISEKSNFTDKN